MVAGGVTIMYPGIGAGGGASGFRLIARRMVPDTAAVVTLTRIIRAGIRTSTDTATGTDIDGQPGE
jgi:hypothetical protein